MEDCDDRANIEWSGTLSEAFPPCPKDVWDGRFGRPCGSTIGEIRKKFDYRGIGLYCENGHMRSRQFIPHGELMPGGPYGSAGTPQHFLSASATKRRSREYQAKDAVRLAVHNARRCLWCDTEPAPRSIRRRFDWLRLNDGALFEDVMRALGEHIASREDIAEIWFAALPAGLQGIVQARFEDSCLQADHVLPVELLREAKEHLSLTIFKYAAKELVAPSCGICNRGRKELLLTRETLLEEKVIAYFFKTKDAAASSPKFAMFQEALIQCIAAIARIDRRKHLTG
jgi:hypothetical protein